MKVIVNGNDVELERDATVATLLSHLGLPMTGIAVEQNKIIVKKDLYKSADLNEGDRLEIVHFVGGG